MPFSVLSPEPKLGPGDLQSSWVEKHVASRPDSGWVGVGSARPCRSVLGRGHVLGAGKWGPHSQAPVTPTEKEGENLVGG